MALIDDVVAYYKFDTNNVTQPDSANSNDGTISGATYTSTGKINGAYIFDGLNDYMSVPSTLMTSQEFTISCWVKIDAFAARGDISRQWASGVFNYIFRYDTDNKIYIYVYKSGVYSATTAALSTDTWYHIVVTFDTSDDLKIYVNAGTPVTTAVGGTRVVSNGVPLFVGSSGGASEFFDGTIDEMGYWSRALTSDEITELYNSGSGLAYPFEPEPTGLNMQIKVNGIWRAVTAGQIKVNGVWRPISTIQQKITGWKNV